jgi:hypothetical protein
MFPGLVCPAVGRLDCRTPRFRSAPCLWVVVLGGVSAHCSYTPRHLFSLAGSMPLAYPPVSHRVPRRGWHPSLAVPAYCSSVDGAKPFTWLSCLQARLRSLCGASRVHRAPRSFRLVPRRFRGRHPEPRRTSVALADNRLLPGGQSVQADLPVSHVSKACLGVRAEGRQGRPAVRPLSSRKTFGGRFRALLPPGA